MNEADFAYLRAFLQQRSGLSLGLDKGYLIDSRLAPLCRRRRIDGIAALVRRLRSGADADTERLVVEMMTTNETFFFRDRAPFELFRDTLLPQLMRARAATRRLRIWCAAASSGQEPYSLAMIVKSLEATLKGWRVDIVATDLSTEMIEKAKAGLYTQFEVQRGLPITLLLAHFDQVGDSWRIAPELRAMVQFRTLNLLKDFSALGMFDIIFCRNLLIYLDAPTKIGVLRRLAGRLPADGALVLGAAETVIGLADDFAPHPDHRGLYIPKAPPAFASGRSARLA